MPNEQLRLFVYPAISYRKTRIFEGTMYELEVGDTWRDRLILHTTNEKKWERCKKSYVIEWFQRTGQWYIFKGDKWGRK